MCESHYYVQEIRSNWLTAAASLCLTIGLCDDGSPVIIITRRVED